MKKLNYLPVLVLLIATLFAISCTKESAPLATVDPLSTTSLQSSIPEIGGIVDLGPINSETRVMATTFSTKSIELDGANVDLMQSSAQIALTIYANLDAQIPAGEYSFSESNDSNSKVPFSFDSAFFGGGVDTNGYAIAPEKIVDGTVIVSRDSQDYSFQLQGHLESGKMFSASVKGFFTYWDNHIYNGNETQPSDNTNTDTNTGTDTNSNPDYNGGY